MNFASLTNIFLFRFPALLIVSVFALMSVGVLHHACEDDLGGQPDQTEHVVLCKCACHHHVYVPDAQVKQVSFSVIRSLVIFDPNSFIPDAEPSGIFRPPKHIV